MSTQTAKAPKVSALSRISKPLRVEILAANRWTGEDLWIAPADLAKLDFQDVDLTDVIELSKLRSVPYESLKAADVSAFKISLLGWLCHFHASDVTALRAALVGGTFYGLFWHLSEAQRNSGWNSDGERTRPRILSDDDELSLDRSPATRWFDVIGEGDTPETCAFSRVALDWMDSWAVLVGQPVTA